MELRRKKELRNSLWCNGVTKYLSFPSRIDSVFGFPIDCSCLDKGALIYEYNTNTAERV
ncbi:unnamed protein product [Musa acuminata subsp. malaccensis]|nr:unnamed protein product [Musa acuminata subsp. malaccensis]